MFSEHGTHRHKHQIDRYFQQHRVVVATAYAPIMFGPAPVLVFRPANVAAIVPSVASSTISVFLSIDISFNPKVDFNLI